MVEPDGFANSSNITKEMSSRSVSIEADGLGFNASGSVLDESRPGERIGEEVLINLGEKDIVGRQLPRISVRVGGQIIQALVDTGASVNFIRPDLFPNKDFSSLPNATFIQLGCQNSTSRSLGHLEVPMEIEGQEYVVKATLLSKLNEKVILGMPFLMENAAIVDIARKCLYFGKRPRQTVFFSQVTKKQFCELSVPEFSEEQFAAETKSEIVKVVQEFPDVFTETIRQPITEATLHEIRVKEEKPFRQCRYSKMSEERKRIVNEEIDKLLEAGVVVPRSKPQEDSVANTRDYPTPKSIRQLRGFLGTAGWLREYIPHFSEVAAPLTDMIDKNRKFKWTAEAENAFQQIKGLVSKPLSLARPDPTRPFCLQTDASYVGIGAVLYQEGPEGRKNVVAYSSSKLNKTEKRYHINEIECLAVIWAVRKWRHFLQDAPFKLFTDNSALLWLDRMKDEKAKLTRWALLLQEYSFEIFHVPGKLNLLPDFLSRNPVAESTASAPLRQLSRKQQKHQEETVEVTLLAKTPQGRSEDPVEVKKQNNISEKNKEEFPREESLSISTTREDQSHLGPCEVLNHINHLRENEQFRKSEEIAKKYFHYYQNPTVMSHNAREPYHK
ncbi:hypothetical protein JTB14_012836 [Gonioctena quinquepunctata]|nr:hypothetical protein JTB14_012836 [Gonioctena quinquepunctata]